MGDGITVNGHFSAVTYVLIAAALLSFLLSGGKHDIAALKRGFAFLTAALIFGFLGMVIGTYELAATSTPPHRPEQVKQFVHFLIFTFGGIGLINFRSYRRYLRHLKSLEAGTGKSDSP